MAARKSSNANAPFECVDILSVVAQKHPSFLETFDKAVGGRWGVPGWVQPACHSIEWSRIRSAAEAKFQQVGQEIK